MLLLRLLGPLAAAFGAAFVFDGMCRRRGLLPPGFRVPWRRLAATLLVTFIFWVGIFSPLGLVGIKPRLDVSTLRVPDLFQIHLLLIITVFGWFALGFAGAAARRPPLASSLPLPPLPPVIPAVSPQAEEPLAGPEAAVPAAALPRRPSGFGRQLAAQLGFRAPHPGREIALGLLLGAAAWGAVLVALLVVVGVVVWLGGEETMPKEPPAIVPWLAGLPVLVRLALSLSAGFVEETFFRGFLQPRIGIALSTGMFVLAHVSYGQPFMLVGIALLSLIYALLVRWRQTIWPAIAAHALFDGVQLLVIIPAVLRVLPRHPGAGAASRTVAVWALAHIW